MDVDSYQLICTDEVNNNPKIEFTGNAITIAENHKTVTLSYDDFKVLETIISEWAELKKDVESMKYYLEQRITVRSTFEGLEKSAQNKQVGQSKQ